MTDTRNPIREDVIKRYAALIEPIVGTDTQLERTLLSSLEQALIQYELEASSNKPPLGNEAGNHLTKMGPKLKDGRKYTASQVLAMSVDDFLYLHPHQHARVHIGLIRYFKGVREQVKRTNAEATSLDNVVRVIDVVGVPKSDANRLKNIGDATVSRVEEYLQKNYGIMLGVKY